MTIKVGEVEALFRYPVKSMGGEALEEAEPGWHGLDGDRRLAFRRIDDFRGFPWLTATKLPKLRIVCSIPCIVLSERSESKGRLQQCAPLRKLYATPWNSWTLVETLDKKTGQRFRKA